MYETLLTRFSSEHPCWTAELLERAGEETEGLSSLADAGLLRECGGVYALTDAGQAEFERAAAEMYLSERPAESAEYSAQKLMTTDLWLEMERCNLQRWGIKRYFFRPQIDVRPALGGNDLFSLSGGTLRWNYTAHSDYCAMTETHPLVSIDERRPELPDAAALEAWNKLPAAPLGIDMLLLCDYDFENYLDFRGHPGDPMRLINADRFAFSAANNVNDQLGIIGRYHLWLAELRHLRIPGFLDSDSHEQGSVNWLIFFAATQKEAEDEAQRLRELGSVLIAPANPMEIWTLSLESLKKLAPRQEVIWDVLPAAGISVFRSLQR